MSETHGSGSVEEVQRVAWTDERLDDLANRMDAGFARTHGEIRELRIAIGVLGTETRDESGTSRAELSNAIRDVRTELKGDIDSLRGELKGDMADLRTELRGDMVELRTELRGDMVELRTELKGDIDSLRAVMIRFGIAIVVCLVGMIATMGGAVVTGSIG
jgi:hypothetical protein